MTIRAGIAGTVTVALAAALLLMGCATSSDDGEGGATTTSSSSGGATGGSGGSGAGTVGGMGGSATGGGGSGGTAGGGGSGGTTTAPTVSSMSPADNTEAVAADTTVSVTFSEAMTPGTITTNTDATCSGSLQLSSDSFTTCVAMTGAPTTSDDVTFTITPAADLDSATTYLLRVTTAAQDADGNPLALQYQSPNGFVVRYAHTIDVNDSGVNDFTMDEALTSSTMGGTIYYSYDDTHVYMGLAHVDIEADGMGSGDKWVYFLFSTDQNLTTGNALSSDGKAKFGAAGTKKLSHHVKIRIDGMSDIQYKVGNGTNWDTDWSPADATFARVDDFIEGAIAISDFGNNPPHLLGTTYTIDYTGDGGNGWLYNMPMGATDGSGMNPVDLDGYIHLQLPTSLVPNDLSQSGLF